MRPIPKFDTDATLNEICSREDFIYKKSLRKSMAPMYVPETGRYNVAALQTGQKGNKKPQKPKVQLSDFELQLRSLRREQAMKERESRIERLISSQDKFAKIAEKENKKPLPCVGNMAEKKLFYGGQERNKLEELNYLLHRKRDYTPESHSQRSNFDMTLKTQEDPTSVDRRQDRLPSSAGKKAQTAATKETDNQGLPFMIGESRAGGELYFEEGQKDHKNSKDLEVINYTKPSAFDGLSVNELISLIEDMEQEIVDLNKDLADEKKSGGKQAQDNIPSSFLQKLKNFLIRSLWDIGSLRTEVSEKDRRLNDLSEIIKKFDPSLASQVLRVESELNSKLYERSMENENMLRLVDELLDQREKQGRQVQHSSFDNLAQVQIDKLRDELDASRHQTSLLSDYFKKLQTFDSSIVRLNDKQLLERGPSHSIELLLRSLDKQATELNEKTAALDQNRNELISLGKKAAQLDELSATDRDRVKKETKALLNLLKSGDDLSAQASDQPQALLKTIREEITKLKLQNEDAISRFRTLSQQDEARNKELRELRGILQGQNRDIDTMKLEKAQLEERFKFSEIEKTNLQDVQYTSQEELKRRLKYEHKKAIDELSDKLRQLSQQVDDKERTIQALATQLNNSGKVIVYDQDALNTTFSYLIRSMYRQDSISAFDNDSNRYLESKLEHGSLQHICNFDIAFNTFKYKINLLESAYQEKIIMSNVILKKCANNLKVFHEYIRVCEQFDPSQSSSPISIQQLNNLGVQKAFVLKVIDDVKAFMKSNNDLLASSQLSSPQTSWQTTTDAIVQQYLKTHDHIDVDGMIMECSTAQLYDAWIERYNENREMYEDMTKQNRTPSPKFAQIGTSNEQEEFKKKTLKSNLTFGDPSKLSQGSSSPHFQSDQYNPADNRGKDPVHQTSEYSRRVTFQHPIHQESRPQPAIDSYRPRTNEQHELPLYQLSGQTDHEEEIEEEKEEPRPARFAHFRGFNEPETSPPQTQQSTRRHMDDTFAITEDHDMYEDIRHQPEDQEPEPEKNSRTRKRAENRSIEATANQPGTERRSTCVEKFDNHVQPDYHGQSDMKGDEDLMLNMLHQQAKIFENQITKQRSLDA